MKTMYFDHAATTKLEGSVLQEMLPYLTEEYGNASSIYKLGRQSRQAIEESRATIAKHLNASPSEIYFMASGSEADNTAIKGIAYANKEKGNHIITSKIEHPAVLETCRFLEKEGFEVTYLNVDSDGLISLEELEKSIKDTTILVTIMYANNEIGTVQDVDNIGEICERHKVNFHTDAVQAVGNIRIDVKKSHIKLLSLSGHKIYGPKGIGVLYVKNGVHFIPVIHGGHQEKGKRAGTENVASIVGIAKAMDEMYSHFDEYNKHLLELREYYFNQVEQNIPYIKINGHRTQRLPGNANVSFFFIEGESLLLALDNKGICASSGSACTSGSLDPSHVLMAIGLKHEIAHGSLRISFGKENTKEQIDFLVQVLKDSIQTLRDMSPFYEDFLNGEYKI